MTNQQILEKAIEKAIKNGFDGTKLWTIDFTPESAVKAILRYHNPSLKQVIFSQDFAKALWGETTAEYYRHDGSEQKSLNGWQYHLQQMVIAPDPIKYLGENI